MTITIGVAMIVCILGVLLYFLSSNGKVQEAGRIMFFTGLLASLLRIGELAIR